MWGTVFGGSLAQLLPPSGSPGALAEAVNIGVGQTGRGIVAWVTWKPLKGSQGRTQTSVSSGPAMLHTEKYKYMSSGSHRFPPETLRGWVPRMDSTLQIGKLRPREIKNLLLVIPRGRQKPWGFEGMNCESQLSPCPPELLPSTPLPTRGAPHAPPLLPQISTQHPRTPVASPQHCTICSWALSSKQPQGFSCN